MNALDWICLALAVGAVVGGYRLGFIRRVTGWAGLIGGIALASKLLLERLEPTEAADLGLRPDEMTYVTVATLDGSSEKAVRDAGSISVTVI